MFPDHLNDIDTYNNEMSKSLEDKIWFTKHISAPDSIIDYGCADGQMIRELSKIYKNTNFIGYDISEQQIKLAKVNMPFVKFTNDFSYVLDSLKNVASYSKTNKTAIIANSVTHEVYNYSKSNLGIINYWTNLFSCGFDYVIIRDLVYKNSWDNIPIYNRIQQKIIDSKYKNLFWEYTKDNNCIFMYHLIQFLLKYRYKENWEREKSENYFPLTYEDYFKIFPSSYSVIQTENYALPFNVKQVKEDFDIDISNYKTHAKFILKKRY